MQRSDPAVEWLSRDEAKLLAGSGSPRIDSERQISSGTMD